MVFSESSNMKTINDADFRSLSLRDALKVLTGYSKMFFPRKRVSFSTLGWMSPSIASLGYHGVVFYMDPRKLGITATLVILAHELGHIESSEKGIMTGAFGEVDAFEQGACFAYTLGVITEYIGYIKYLAAKYSRTEHAKSVIRSIIPPDKMNSTAEGLMCKYNVQKAGLWSLPESVDLLIAKWGEEYQRRF